MDKTSSLDLKEITTILINVIAIKIFFTFPKRVIDNAGNAAWIQIAYVSVIAIFIFSLTTKAYKNCENVSIIKLSEKIGGKPLKMIIGFLISIVLSLNLASTMRIFPETVKMALLPNTPMDIILIIFAMVVSIAALGGLDAIARIHSIFIPIVSGILTVFFLLLIHHIKIYNIFPILGKGTYNIFIKGIGCIDYFNDILVLNLLLPYVKNMKDAKKAGYRAIIVSSIDIILILLLYCFIYPYPTSQKNLVPIYQLTRLVEIGDFFQRFEAFFEFVWSLSILLYSSLYIWLICEVWKESFDLKYEKPLVFPIMAIITIFSFTLHSMHQIIFNEKYLSIIIVFTAFVLPIIIPWIYKKRKITNG